ncbi:hypothetical protein JF531_07715 [Microbacterium esteraromaticum]|uniref:AbiTii domain-containing protein n=1 Tax=Microbacterium esteraromaticum TaxID=57043 RepID=UPI001A8FDBD9|nr:hypothetical protein [Microbacterium esteraromaticum]
MTVLDDIIESATDSSVAITDLLRKVQVVAHRLGAEAIVAWVRQELAGYSSDATIPAYRSVGGTVIGAFSGVFQQFRQVPLTVHPPEMAHLWKAELRMPLSELQALSESDDAPSMEWGGHDVDAFAESGAFTVEPWELFSARTVISTAALKGVQDIIRSTALEFALELQGIDPAAGSVSGPTITTEPDVASAVFNITNNIYGDGANVAAGSQINQCSHVERGDRNSLKREAEALGLSSEDAEEFVRAVVEEQDIEKPKVRAFLERVRGGAFAITGSVGSDVVAGSLVELGKGFLGL